MLLTLVIAGSARPSFRSRGPTRSTARRRSAARARASPKSQAAVARSGEAPPVVADPQHRASRSRAARCDAAASTTSPPGSAPSSSPAPSSASTPSSDTLLCTGEERPLAYDALVLAVGAQHRTAFRKTALTFTGDRSTLDFSGLLADIDEGYSHTVSFVVPPGTTWPLPLYELALMTAQEAWAHGHRQHQDGARHARARSHSHSSASRSRRRRRRAAREGRHRVPRQLPRHAAGRRRPPRSGWPTASPWTASASWPCRPSKAP